MNIYTYLGTIRDAIHDDNTIQTYCAGIWSRNHHVYVGVDQENPPDPITEYPIVSLFPAARGAGEQQTNETIMIACNTGIRHEGLKTGLKTNVVEYQGIEYIIEFTERVMDALIGALTAGAFIQSIDQEFTTNETYPIFICQSEIAIFRPYSQGDNVIP